MKNIVVTIALGALIALMAWTFSSLPAFACEGRCPSVYHPSGQESIGQDEGIFLPSRNDGEVYGQESSGPDEGIFLPSRNDGEAKASKEEEEFYASTEAAFAAAVEIEEAAEAAAQDVLEDILGISRRWRQTFETTLPPVGGPIDVALWVALDEVKAARAATVAAKNRYWEFVFEFGHWRENSR